MGRYGRRGAKWFSFEWADDYYAVRKNLVDDGKVDIHVLPDRNMLTGALLGPYNYELLHGFRIYEFCRDDPGLCKPAFLAAKIAGRFLAGPLTGEKSESFKKSEKFLKEFVLLHVQGFHDAMNPSNDDSYPTRASQLNRLKDTADHQRWTELG